MMNSIVITLILFILGMIVSLMHMENESKSVIGMSIGIAVSIILSIYLFQSNMLYYSYQIVEPSVEQSVGPSYDQELIEFLMNIINEKEEKNDIFYFIFKIVGYIITYVLGLMAPYFTKRISKKLKKRKKERKKIKNDKKKNQDDSKTKRE